VLREDAEDPDETLGDAVALGHVAGEFVLPLVA
jgi:hypothetical protein